MKIIMMGLRRVNQKKEERGREKCIAVLWEQDLTWPGPEEKEPNMREMSKLELRVLMILITDDRGQLEGKEESYKVPRLEN